MLWYGLWDTWERYPEKAQVVAKAEFVSQKAKHLQWHYTLGKRRRKSLFSWVWGCWSDNLSVLSNIKQWCHKQGQCHCYQQILEYSWNDFLDIYDKPLTETCILNTLEIKPICGETYIPFARQQITELEFRGMGRICHLCDSSSQEPHNVLIYHSTNYLV